MYKNYNQQSLDDDAAAKTLISYLEDHQSVLGLEDSFIYHNFPLYVGSDDIALPTHVLIISKKYGIIVFKCVNNYETTKKDFPEEIESLEQSHSLILSKLIKSKSLRRGLGEIKFPLHLVLFINLTDEEDQQSEFDSNSYINKVFGRSKISNFFSFFKSSAGLSDNNINEIRSHLEGSSGIVKVRKKNLDTSKEKGKILDEIERKIALFDEDQSRSSFYVPNKPQRIRGLAGSGKTIVLAMKVAQIHIKEPDAQIIYTFYTKSLYDFIKRLITRFYRQFSEKDPNWDNIHILHAWGGKNLPGVYSTVCNDNNLKPYTLRDVALEKDKFNLICKKLLEYRIQKSYDYVVLDEAQDFPVNFYRLCRKITTGDKIFWALDEFQNVINVNIQNVRETFGVDENNKYIELDGDSDIVLHQCYRNDRKILLCAFALGLGIYSDKIIQMPEGNDHWEDLGFKVIQGESKEGDQMIIDRPKNTSPIHLERADAVKYKSFESLEKECEYVSKCIIEDINNGVPPEDILVISLDETNIRRYFSALRNNLYPEVNVFNLLDAPFNNTSFRQDGLVTLSSIFKAKGNESGSVYIVGTDSIFLSLNKNSIIQRNKIFTAITRAKMWVTITGVGDVMDVCIEEIKKALENYPSLKFIMPNPSMFKVIQRDLGAQQEIYNKLEKLKKQAEQLGLDLYKDIKKTVKK